MIFSEPPVDAVYDELPAGKDDTVLAVEYLPGQYDQRADSAMQCLQMLTMKNDSLVRTAQVLVLSGSLSADDVAAIKHYCINRRSPRSLAGPRLDAGNALGKTG